MELTFNVLKLLSPGLVDDIITPEDKISIIKVLDRESVIVSVELVIELT